ncbi:MAG: hypothetical protein HJJLKODD_03012 [Phycisphaerae bacterium]|nr:hypothetical protein [Phycisphaerae bacterium]
MLRIWWENMIMIQIKIGTLFGYLGLGDKAVILIVGTVLEAMILVYGI